MDVFCFHRDANLIYATLGAVQLRLPKLPQELWCAMGIFDFLKGKNGRQGDLAKAVVNGQAVEVARLAGAGGCDPDGLLESGSPYLHVAVSRGDADTVRALIEAGATVNKYCLSGDDSGLTALHIACLLEDPREDIVDILISASADPKLVTEAGGNRGASALFFASARGYAEIVSRLIRAGAQVDLPCLDSMAPLHIAAYMGHVEVVAVLAAAGADLHIQTANGNTPLHYAISEDKFDVVAKLLDVGADPGRAAHLGETPLHFAAQAGHLQMVELLLHAGADPVAIRADGVTPGDLASEAGFTHVAQRLSERKPPKGKTQRGAPAADRAVARGNALADEGEDKQLDELLDEILDVVLEPHLQKLRLAALMFGEHENIHDYMESKITEMASEVVEEHGDALGNDPDETFRRVVSRLNALLERKNDDAGESSDSEEVDDDDDAPPLFSAVMHEDLPALRKLIKAGANIEEEIEGMTPLVLAAAANKPKALRELIKLGADIEACPEGKTTPLTGAINAGVSETAKILLKQGASPNHCVSAFHELSDDQVIRIDGVSPLIIAVQAGNVDLVDALVKSGADIDHLASHGASPLIVAIQQHENEIAKKLIRYGAAVDHDPPKELPLEQWALLNPLIAAASNGNVEIFDLLLRKGARLDIVDPRGANLVKIAVMARETEILRKLLKAGVDPDLLDKEGFSALKNACKSGDEEAVKLLLKHGANAQGIQSDSFPLESLLYPLMYACDGGSEEVVRLLLGAGADPAARGAGGDTAIFHAIEAGHDYLIGELVSMGAPVDALDRRGRTALQYALVAHDDQDVTIRLVKALLEAGASPALCGNSGTSPVTIAEHRGYADAAALLQTVGEACPEELSEQQYIALLPENQQANELLTAINTADTEKVGTILRAGVDPNHPFDNVILPLSAAVASCLHEADEEGSDPTIGREIVSILCAAGARLFERDPIVGSPAAFASGHGGVEELACLAPEESWPTLDLVEVAEVYRVACVCGKRENAAWLRNILNSRSREIDQQDAQGYTKLFYAAADGDVARVRSLLDENADANRRDAFGETALSLAFERAQKQVISRDVVNLLICHGAQSLVPENGATEKVFLVAARQGALGALLGAIEWDPSDISLASEDARQMLEATDIEGNTALMIAAQGGFPDLVRTLLLLGADPDRRNFANESAYTIALKKDFHPICEILAEFSAADAANDDGAIVWTLTTASETRRSGYGKGYPD